MSFKIGLYFLGITQCLLLWLQEYDACMFVWFVIGIPFVLSTYEHEPLLFDDIE